MNKITVGIAVALAFVIMNRVVVAGEGRPIASSMVDFRIPAIGIMDKPIGISHRMGKSKQSFRTLRKFSASRMTKAIRDPVFSQLEYQVVVCLQDPMADERIATAVMLESIVKANPRVTSYVVELLQHLLKKQDADADVKKEANGVLERILEANPAFWLKEKLATGLRNQDRDVRNETGEKLGRIVSTRPDLAPQVVELILPLLLDRDRDVKITATYMSVMTVTITSFATSALRDSTVLLLKDPNDCVIENAIAVLESIAMKKPDLVTTELRDALVLRLRDSYGDVRRNAAWALSKIRDVAPGLIPPDISSTIDRLRGI
ncbi:MAG: hypothetical protein LBM19_01800 [Holosporales bacterium]|jgi:HEAT repeat protein|nr:hypothetical protein [Holosporales bacterium]